jgi:hypothetical protein
VNQRTIAKTFGYVFLAVGVLGFIPNPIASGDGIFQVNALHNIVHLASGALALVAGYTSEGNAQTYNVGFGAVYGLVTLLGLLGVSFAVDLLNLNLADNVLHLAITLGLVGPGLTLKSRGSQHA